MLKTAIQLSNTSNSRSKYCWILQTCIVRTLIYLLQASILGHLEKLNLLSPSTCFIEFGAGRGEDGIVTQRLDGLASFWSGLLATNNYNCFSCFINHLGKLSHWVQKAIGDRGAHYVLVDRANCRRKVNEIYMYSLISNLTWLQTNCNILVGLLSVHYCKTGHRAGNKDEQLPTFWNWRWK